MNSPEVAQPLSLDGSIGEGGGQVLRTALSLSLCLQRPFRIDNIRSRREGPGLQPQHLAAVRAAAAISDAEVEGDEPGSTALSFTPGPVRAGVYHFDIGTAGSTALLLQTLLPALMLGEDESTLTLDGGTHNPRAPTFEYLNQAYLPMLNRMGPQIQAELVRPGFYPEGGGRIRVHIRPAVHLWPLQIPRRGKVLTLDAQALVANLPLEIAERELATLQSGLAVHAGGLQAHRAEDCISTGNAVWVSVYSEHITEVFSVLGEKGVPAEEVAQGLLDSVRGYLAEDVPVGPWLADQILLPMALAGQGGFRTVPPSPHTNTQIEVIAAFTGRRFQVRPADNGHVFIELE
jgi:RNA 3'-terminal phosphate cyclase (ATP)